VEPELDHGWHCALWNPSSAKVGTATRGTELGQGWHQFGTAPCGTELCSSNTNLGHNTPRGTTHLELGLNPSTKWTHDPGWRRRSACPLQQLQVAAKGGGAAGALIPRDGRGLGHDTHQTSRPHLGHLGHNTPRPHIGYTSVIGHAHLGHTSRHTPWTHRPQLGHNTGTPRPYLVHKTPRTTRPPQNVKWARWGDCRRSGGVPRPCRTRWARLDRFTVYNYRTGIGRASVPPDRTGE